MSHPDAYNKGTPPLCRTVPDPDIFFPDIEVLGSPRAVEDVEKQAKAVCGQCKFVKECFQYGYENDEPGIWGGTTQKERRLIRRRAIKARRGRPARPVTV